MELDVTPSSMLYLMASSGFKAGGFYGSLPPNSFGPERLTSYALGSKNRWFDNRVQLNAEVFYWDYKDQQTVHLGAIRPTGFGLITENIGRVPMRGVDVELKWLVTPRDRLGLGVNYLSADTSRFVYNAVLTSPTAAVSSGCDTSTPFFNPSDNNFYRSVNCSGRPMPRAPEWTGTFDFEHTFLLPGEFQLTAGVHSVYSSGQYITIDYLPGAYQDSYHTTDAYLTLSAREDKWSVRAWVRNIEDDAVLNSAFQHPFVPGGFFGSYRAPRTVGLTLNAGF
jgi:iron complex outermembrane receptor protein